MSSIIDSIMEKESDLQYSQSTQLETSYLIQKGPVARKSSSSPFKSIILLCKGPDRLWSTILVSIMAALISVIGGFALGFPSSSLLELNDLGPRSIKNVSILDNFYGPLAPLGALFGGILAGSSADILGRRPTLILIVIPSFIGWLLLGVSWFITKPVIFKTIIVMGRLISGFGLGWAQLSGSVYIGEVSPPSLRGLFSSLPQLLLNCGLLLVYGMGAIPHFSYYKTAFVACGLTLALLLGVIWLPETPRFLLSKKKVKKALRTLEFLRGPNGDIQNEMVQIEEANSKQKKLSLREFLREITHRNVYIPFLLMLLVNAFQQLSGVNALVFYSAHILEKAGFGTNSPIVALSTIGLTAVIFTFVGAITVDLFGRKILLIASGTIMCLGSAGLGFTMRYSSLTSLAIVSVIGYQIGFNIGFGAIPWVMIAEMIPLRVRGILGGVLAAVNWGLAALITGFYLVYAKNIGQDVAWWTFAFLNAIGVGLIALLLPETKGKSLEVMEQQMSSGFKFCM